MVVQIITIVILALTQPVLAYEVDTHSELSIRAAQNSAKLASFVRERLGLPEGIETTIGNRTLAEWIGRGSIFEDAFPRFVNHFHNPLRAWSNAGLTVGGLQVGQSAPLWAQNQTGAGPDASWTAARYFLYQSLTNSDPAIREIDLRETMTLLGNQIHLLQDMAQTAHTRNDPHIKFLFDPEPLEVHIDRVRDNNIGKFRAWLNDSVAPSDTLLKTQSPNPAARAPIANLIDTSDRDEIPTAAKNSTNVGLAEFANTNFFSADTILDLERFPFPRHESLGPRDRAASPFVLAQAEHYYRAKIADGVTISHAVAEGPLGPYLDDVPELFRHTLYLDATVVEDYAAILLPRAVGYSTALLEYFFRGDLELVPLTRGKYPFAVENKSDEPMEGAIQVFYDDEDGNRYSVGSTQTDGELAPGALVPISISWPTNLSAKTPGEFLVVFKGRHGLEGLAASDTDFAVVAGRSQVPPPSLAPGVNPGPSHDIIDPDHVHEGASASDPNGDLASYAWSWVSCPATCPDLSNASGGLSGGTPSVPVAGPGFTLTQGGPHTLKLEVRDAAGHRSSSQVTHELGAAITRGYRMSDGSADAYPQLGAWAWGANTAYVGELYEWDRMSLWIDADHDVFVEAEPFIACDANVEPPCGEVVSTNFEGWSGHPPGMIFRAGHSFVVRYLINFTKPGTHAVGVRHDTWPPYWYFDWYVYIRAQ
jgi:hypothetical protein